MFATAELGRAFYQYATLTKAVEAGTRYYASAVNDLTLTTDPVATTINLIVTASPDGSGSAVLPNGGISVSGGDITSDGVHVFVTAEYDFVPMLGAKLPIVGSLASYTMTVSHTMRAL
jgi:Flp pilus assembly protein TadG